MTLLASRYPRVIGVVLACGLAGCAERIGFGGLGGSSSAGGAGTAGAETEPLAAAPTTAVTSAPLAIQGGPGGPRTPPPVNMAGRWTLTSPGGGGCAMNFGATAGAAE